MSLRSVALALWEGVWQVQVCSEGLFLIYVRSFLNECASFPNGCHYSFHLWKQIGEFLPVVHRFTHICDYDSIGCSPCRTGFGQSTNLLGVYVHKLKLDNH